MFLTAPYSGEKCYTYKRGFVDASGAVRVENAHDMIHSRTGVFSEVIPIDANANNGTSRYNSFPFRCVGRCCIELNAYLGHHNSEHGHKNGYVGVGTYMSNEPIGPGFVYNIPSGYKASAFM